MMESITITNNERLLRFETPVGDDFAFVDYRWYKGNIALMHTFVPEAGRGKGISSALAKHVLEYAKEKSLQVMVYCPFMAQYISQHPEYALLVNRTPHR